MKTRTSLEYFVNDCSDEKLLVLMLSDSANYEKYISSIDNQ